MNKKFKILYYDRKMPYLFKYTGMPAGGAAKEFFSWNKGFRQAEHDFAVLTWKGAKNYIDREVDMEFIESYDLKKGIPILRRFYYRIPKLYQSIKKYNPDIIMQACCNFDTGVFAVLSFLLKKKFVYRVENDDESDGRYKNRIRKIDRISYMMGIRLADGIACQNKYQYLNFHKKFPNKNVFQINVPLNFEKDLHNLNKKKEDYIAWVGIFQKQKNMPALKEIAEKCPETKFKIAGGPQGKLDEDAKLAIHQLKQMKNVEFVGFLSQKEINQFFMKANALLNTSHYEGFSLTFLEAWSVGTPVITTINANPDNIIKEFDLGFVGNTYDEIPDFINNLSNQKLINSYSQKCVKYVLEHHDPVKLADKFSDQMTKLYINKKLN